MPGTAFQLPEGDVFKLGTIWDQETVRQLVLFQYTPVGATEPLVEFALSAKSADLVIAALQKHANEARYVNGKPRVSYHLGVVVTPRRAKRKPRPPRTPKAPKTSASSGAADPPATTEKSETPPPI